MKEERSDQQLQKKKQKNRTVTTKKASKCRWIEFVIFISLQHFHILNFRVLFLCMFFLPFLYIWCCWLSSFGCNAYWMCATNIIFRWENPFSCMCAMYTQKSIHRIFFKTSFSYPSVRKCQAVVFLLPPKSSYYTYRIIQKHSISNSNFSMSL